MQEVAVGSQTCARTISDRFIQTMLADTEKMKSYLTSIKIDYYQRRPLEIEAIFANPLAKALARGVNLPQISCLYRQ